MVTRMGLTDLPDRGDRKQWPALKARLAEEFRSRTRAEWEAVFEGSDACVSPVLSMRRGRTASAQRGPGRLRRRRRRSASRSPAPRLLGVPDQDLSPATRLADLSAWGLSAEAGGEAALPGGAGLTWTPTCSTAPCTRATPAPVYAWLRAHSPVHHDAANGLWGISRHADITAIERDPGLWTSTGGYRPQLPSDPSMIGWTTRSTPSTAASSTGASPRATSTSATPPASARSSSS